MSKYNNYDITGMYYSGHTIVRAYGCGGELVFGSEPEPTPTPTYNFRWSAHTASDGDAYKDCSTADVMSHETSSMSRADMAFAVPSTNGITSLVIGDCTKEIEQAMCNAMTGLTSVYISDSVTGFTGGEFNGCSSLSTVRLPQGITSIPASMFDACPSLTSITIPDSVTTIGNDAFSNAGLTALTIPANVTSIGDEAFFNNQNLRTVTMMSSTPPTLGLDVFNNGYGVITSLTAIRIPQGSLSAYQNDTSWQYYTNLLVEY